MTTKKQMSMAVIKVGRRLFANTRIQRWPVTTTVYRRVFRFGFVEDEITASLCGVSLSAPTKDTTLVPGLAGGFYERIELRIYERLVRRSQMVVDVGGNIGLYTCIGAKQLPESGRLIVFEPVPENIYYLRKNIEQNNLADKVRLEVAAVGAEDGEATIYLAEHSIGTHSVSAKNAGQSQETIKVPMVSLDSYLRKGMNNGVDVLKIDVEGYDGFALQGALGTLKKAKPALLVEFAPWHLANCNFAPNDFLDLIFDTYQNIFLVNEVQNSLQRCTKKQLLGFGERYLNANLVATDRPEHIEEIEDLIN